MSLSRPSLAAGIFSILFVATAAAAPATFKSEIRKMGLDYRGTREFKITLNRHWGAWLDAIGTSSAASVPGLPSPGSGSSSAQWVMTADSDSIRLRLKAQSNVGPAQALKDEDLQISRINYLYIGNAAYPGMITRKFEVPSELKPEIVQESSPTGKILILHATSSLTYGAGSEDLIAYRAVLGFRYCRKTKVLVTVELFRPKDIFDRTQALRELADFGCAAP